MRVSKEKNAEYQRQWYARNRELQKSRVKERKQELSEWFKKLKATLECSKCKQNHPATLDFHHVNPDEKEVNISVSFLRN